MANLIVEAVRADQTGVATGMNTIVRTIGGAIGAVVAATILAANVLPNGEPDRHGYTVTFTVCAFVMVVACSPRSPFPAVAGRRPGRSSPLHAPPPATETAPAEAS